VARGTVRGDLHLAGQAYKVKDWLSIGAGPFFLYGKFDQRVAVMNVRLVSSSVPVMTGDRSCFVLPLVSA
jgi:hypothetical protein